MSLQHCAGNERKQMNSLNYYGIDTAVTVNGRPVRAYTHEGKIWIESRIGTEWAVQIQNNNSYRVEAVVAVDGLSVISGKPASKTDIGYVINANDKVVIKGYRKDMEEVGSFRFTSKKKSYAASRGQATNAGVIAIAIYAEKINYVWPTYNFASTSISVPTWTGLNTCTRNVGGLIGSGVTTTQNTSTVFRTATGGSVASSSLSSGASNCGAQASYCCNASAAPFEHGTEWGSKVQDKVVTTSFDRGSLIYDTEIFYDSRQNLESYGVKVIPEKQAAFPTGFPLSFATPPTNWRG